MKQQKLAEMSEEDRLVAQAQEWKEKAEQHQQPSNEFAKQKFRKYCIQSPNLNLPFYKSLEHASLKFLF